MSRVMVIDALNQFLRNYIVDPSLSKNGQPIGGAKGFLKSLQKLTREIKPDEIVIVWDGAYGSRKRKSINKNYKEGRKPVRLNRNVRNLTEDQELQNKVWQQLRVIEYLNELPVIQLKYDQVEADDVISFVTQYSKYDGWQKVIVSADKDFFQLCDNETVVFRPIQKEIMSTKSIVQKFNIHPTNFALARAIVGDNSDNLVGVKGVGLPTVAKRLPFLAEGKYYTIDDVIGYCKEAEENIKAYSNIIEQEDLIKENYSIMQLYAPLLSAITKRHVQNVLTNFVPEFNKTGLLKLLISDGAAEYNWNELFVRFRKIIADTKKTG